MPRMWFPPAEADKLNVEEYLALESAKTSSFERLLPADVATLRSGLDSDDDMLKHAVDEMTKRFNRVSRISPETLTTEDEDNIIDEMCRYRRIRTGQDYEPSHLPTTLRNLSFLVKKGPIYLRLGSFEPTWDDVDGLHLKEELALIHRKHQEYLFQAFFSIPTERLASNSLLLREVREVIIASRLQMQIFLRRTMVKYQAIEWGLFDEENDYAQACFEEIERMEQQYRTKEDELKGKILTQWEDFSNFMYWYTWVDLEDEMLQDWREDRQIRMSSDDEADDLASGTRADQVSELLLDAELENLPEEDQECNICKELYSSKEDTGEFSAGPEKPVRLPSCGHTFGDTCIKQWLEQSTTCPICHQHFRELTANKAKQDGEESVE